MRVRQLVDSLTIFFGENFIFNVVNILFAMIHPECQNAYFIAQLIKAHFWDFLPLTCPLASPGWTLQNVTQA
jgi:hypothetical protein